MGKICQIVIGPAGSGKTTYCKTMKDHATAQKRNVFLVNLDPATEQNTEDGLYSIDIRELISLNDVMSELKLGPNGGLVYCIEYLLENLDWLREEVADYDDDYLIIDCPGQTELYTHIPVMKKVVEELQRIGYTCCIVYCIDVQFCDSPAKFISGSMMALSCMINFECPHLNVITKCDLAVSGKINLVGLQQMNEPLNMKKKKKNEKIQKMIENGEELEESEEESEEKIEKIEKSKFGINRDLGIDNSDVYEKKNEPEFILRDFLNPDMDDIAFQLNKFAVNESFKRLNSAIASVISDYGLIEYLPLNIEDETSVDYIMSKIDYMTQYGEDLEPKETEDIKDEEEEEIEDYNKMLNLQD